MADEKEFVLTREGKLELENELDTLKNVTRKEVSEKIKRLVHLVTFRKMPNMMKQKMNRQK